MSGQVLTQHDTLGLPVKITLLGEYLVVADAAGDPAIHLFVTATGEYVQSLGRKGKGPGEFQRVVNLQVAPSGDAVWAFDLMLQRLSRIAREPGGGFHVDSLIPIHAGVPLVGPVMTDRHLISLGMFDGGRLAILQLDGDSVLGFRGRVPGDGSAPAHVMQQAYRATLAARPDGERLVAVNRYADLVEMYSAAGDSIRFMVGPDGFGPIYNLGIDPEGPAFSTDGTLRFGYIDVTTTNSVMLALYSGQTRAEGEGRANFGRLVRLLDWTGHVLAVSELDRPAIGIAVDTAAGMVYTIVHDPKPAIMRYSLEELFPGSEMVGES